MYAAEERRDRQHGRHERDRGDDEQGRRARGLERAASQTPSEFLDALARRSDIPSEERRDAEVIVRAFERERFSKLRASGEEIEASLAAAERVRLRERERSRT